MKKIKIIFIIILGLLLMTGCENKTSLDPNIVGTWEYVEQDAYTVSYTYKEDGTGVFIMSVVKEDGTEETSTKKFTYETKDSKIYTTFEGDTDVFENGYEIKEDILYWEDTFGDKTEMKKKVEN